MSAAVHQLDRLQGEVDALLARLAGAESRWQPWIDTVAPENRCSAINLVHFLALHQVDLRDMQRQLTGLGLSSPALSQTHVQATLRLVSAAISALRGLAWTPSDEGCVPVTDAARLIARNAHELLGQATEPVAITLPSEAAVDPGIARTLIDSGMLIARIDCARDDATAWKAMAANVRSAAVTAGRTGTLVMTLAGPQLLTGPVEPGPPVVRLRPTRNAQGQVVAAGRGWLTSARRPARPPEPNLATLPVKADWLAQRAEGDELTLRDTRGSKRQLLLAAAAPGGFVVTTEKTTYVGTGTVLKAGRKDSAKVGELPAAEQSFRLTAGDLLRLTHDCTPTSVEDDQPPRIGCTLPGLFSHAEVGQRIVFGAGELAGVIIAVKAAKRIDIRITHPTDSAEKLSGGTKIAAPDTDLPLSAVTNQDLAALGVVIELADIVALSSVREPADVSRLFDELDRLGDADLGVVLELDGRQGAEPIAQLLLTAMRRRRIGVAIPAGPRHEETLRWCQAAHLPVVALD
ncbi:pyruvate kinase [Mycolicibacterium sp. Dal123E01]|uniref:pyruvate kinase n=1 Tax=Mycolicibacterium sp. Dal123E01 TaxID=3457578 RepID=UPI00403E6531